MRARLWPWLLRWAAFVSVAVAGAAACQAPGATGSVPAEGAAIAAATLPAGAPAAAPLRRLSVGVASRSASNVVQYVGIEHGVFARYGFDVDVQQLRSTIAPAALQSNQIDYFTGVDSAVRAAIAGNPIKVVAVSRRSPVFALVAKPELASLRDLKGRVVGTSAASGSNYYALKRLLDVSDMSISDVDVLVVGDAPVQLQHLLQGTIDATNLSAPAVFEALDRGYRQLAYVPDYVTFASTGLVTSDETIRRRRDEVKRLIAAHVESARLIQADRQGAIELLAKYFDVPSELAARTYDFEVPALTTDPRMSVDEIQLTIREELTAGHIQVAPQLAQIVASDLIEEAMALLH